MSSKENFIELYQHISSYDLSYDLKSFINLLISFSAAFVATSAAALVKGSPPGSGCSFTTPLATSSGEKPD